MVIESGPRRRLGVFGGTFDPVHIGHLIVASEVMYHLQLDEVVFVPSGRPPHKIDHPITPEAHRLEMVRLAIEGNPRFRVSTVDIDRPELSYTADTLALLRGAHPEAELFFLMGADSLRDLPNWHDPNRVARQATLAVAVRPGVGVGVDLDAVIARVPDAAGRITLVDVPLIEVSSSDLRRRVAEGWPIRYQVPDAVYGYIERAGLYRASAP